MAPPSHIRVPFEKIVNGKFDFSSLESFEKELFKVFGWLIKDIILVLKSVLTYCYIVAKKEGLSENELENIVRGYAFLGKNNQEFIRNNYKYFLDLLNFESRSLEKSRIDINSFFDFPLTANLDSVWKTSVAFPSLGRAEMLKFLRNLVTLIQHLENTLNDNKIKAKIMNFAISFYLEESWKIYFNLFVPEVLKSDFQNKLRQYLERHPNLPGLKELILGKNNFVRNFLSQRKIIFNSSYVKALNKTFNNPDLFRVFLKIIIDFGSPNAVLDKKTNKDNIFSFPQGRKHEGFRIVIKIEDEEFKFIFFGNHDEYMKFLEKQD